MPLRRSSLASLRGTMPTLDEAQTLVSHLDTWFPPDADNGKPFYRVWWWADDRDLRRYPEA